MFDLDESIPYLNDLSTRLIQYVLRCVYGYLVFIYICLHGLDHVLTRSKSDWPVVWCDLSPSDASVAPNSRSRTNCNTSLYQ